MDCYCLERKETPDLAEIFKDLPEGYCGYCSVCGEPGHTRAHPHAPVSDAWCDLHYEEVLNGKVISLGSIVGAAIMMLVLGLAINWVRLSFF